jgi:hypothetical protein
MELAVDELRDEAYPGSEAAHDELAQDLSSAGVREEQMTEADLTDSGGARRHDDGDSRRPPAEAEVGERRVPPEE